MSLQNFYRYKSDQRFGYELENDAAKTNCKKMHSHLYLQNRDEKD